jgi:hypothetical protein
LTGPVWIGINVKIFHHQLFKWSDMGFGGDVGLFFFPEQRFSFGINIQNVIKPSVKLIEETCSFPAVLRLGGSYRPWGERFTVVADMVWSEDRRPVFGAGLEYKPFQMLHLRTGVNQSYMGLGLGLWKDQRTYEVQLDYTFEIPHFAGGMFGFGHNFSLSVFFGGFRAKAYCPVTAFSPTSGEEGKNIAWLYFNIKPRREVKRWQVLIKDESGIVVRKIGAWGEPPYRIAWDGKDDRAILVPDGRYYYSLKVIEIDGRLWEYEGYLSTMYTVGVPGTILIKSKKEEPTYILEEKKERKEEVKRRRRIRYKRKRR